MSLPFVLRNRGNEIKPTPAVFGSSTTCTSCDQPVFISSPSKLNQDEEESVSLVVMADPFALAENQWMY